MGPRARSVAGRMMPHWPRLHGIVGADRRFSTWAVWRIIGSTMTVASILWNRLDTPGHDACRLIEKHGGWELEGTAVFVKTGMPARLDYNVARTAKGSWTLDGDDALPSMDCVDLDLGFTPATNLIALRRLDLPVGQRATTFTAWLDDDTFSKLEVL